MYTYFTDMYTPASHHSHIVCFISPLRQHSGHFPLQDMEPYYDSRVATHENRENDC